MSETPQKPENDKKQVETEWTFSFEQFGEGIAQLMHQLGIGEDADLQTTTFTEGIDGSARAKVRLELTVGRAFIKALTDSDQLIDAQVVSIGAVEMVTATEGDTKTVRMRQKRNTDGDDLLKPMKDAVDTVARNNELLWDVSLSPQIPLELDINAAVTINDFDLSTLNVPRLKFSGGTGKTSVTLPTGVCNAVIKGGVGEFEVTIPDNAKSTLEMDLGAGTTDITVGNANVKATIEGGVGNCTITVPAGSALRVRGESGLGNIEVPETCEPVQIDSDFISESGIWETPGYEFAVHKIDLRYEGGVGSLVVKEVQPEHG